MWRFDALVGLVARAQRALGASPRYTRARPSCLFRAASPVHCVPPTAAAPGPIAPLGRLLTASPRKHVLGQLHGSLLLLLVGSHHCCGDGLF